MASMNRNVNLEEVNSDAFMGISYLNHQTLFQKIIFIVGIIFGIAINLLGTFLLNLNINLTMLFTLLPIFVGVAFGCNYNEDLSLIQYFKLLITNPVETYFSMPKEDLNQLHQEETRIKEDLEAKQRQEEKMSDEAQKKLLIKLGIGAAVAVIVVIVIIVCGSMMETEEVHHTVSAIENTLETSKA